MAELSDVPKDVIHAILLLLVSSYDGAQDFARALSVCKLFYGFAKDQKLEEALFFDNVSITIKFRTILQSNDLLFRCAKVGNLSAQHLLSKVLVMSSSSLVDKKRKRNQQLPNICHSAVRFVNLIKAEGAGSHHHAQLVQSFLRRCTSSEIVELGEHLINYVRYFAAGNTSHHSSFLCRVNAMIMFGKDIDAGAQVDLDLHELRNMIDAKHIACRQQDDKSIGEGPGKELDLLLNKMSSMLHLSFVRRCFDHTRIGALEDFATFFIELK